MHSTQFAIRETNHGLYRPVLELAAETVRALRARHPRPFVMVAGLSGPTAQATSEAEIALTYGYDVGLLSLGALARASTSELLAHCRAVADVMPLFGFYLQPAIGGRVLCLPASAYRDELAGEMLAELLREQGSRLKTCLLGLNLRS